MINTCTVPEVNPFSHREKVPKGRMRGNGGRVVARTRPNSEPCTPHPSLRATFSVWEKEVSALPVGGLRAHHAG